MLMLERLGYNLTLRDASLQMNEMSPSAVGQLRAVELMPPT